MQPYFFPYIGYFQLIAAVDLFIVYDNIQYTKKGWINRNRFLQNGKDVMFSLPLKKDSDYLDVRERELSADFNRQKLLNQISGAYRRAPHFAETISLIDEVLGFGDSNLFGFIYNALLRTCEHLGISTEIRISSEIPIDHDLKAENKVLALCKSVGATTYVNPIGGMELYSRDTFRASGIDLKFLQPHLQEYVQFGHDFVPGLSLIDVMMFNGRDEIRRVLDESFELL